MRLLIGLFTGLVIWISVTQPALADLTVWTDDCQTAETMRDQLPVEYSSLQLPVRCDTPYSTFSFVSEADEEQAYRWFVAQPFVTGVDRDIRASTQSIAYDPDAADQWHLGSQPLNLEFLHTRTTDCSGVVYIVMDSGIDAYQSELQSWNPDIQGDLAGRLVANPNGLNWETINAELPPQQTGLNLHCPANSSDCLQDDYQGHGTHVAGLIGANWNDRYTAGVCNNAAIVPINFLGFRGGSPANIYDSWAYVEQLIELYPSDTRFIWNNSWAIGSLADTRQLERILSKYNDRLLHVSAAGNSGSDLDAQPVLPAAMATRFSNAMSIGNLAFNGQLHSTSNSGFNSVDFALPGTDILSLWLNNTALGEAGTRVLTGTSMAAPIASGIAGLLWTMEPELTAPQIRSRLLSAARSDSWVGPVRYSGILDTRHLLGIEDSATVNSYQVTAEHYQIQGALLNQIAGASLNNRDLEITYQSAGNLSVRRPEEAFSGYLLLRDASGDELAKLWLEHSLKPIVELSGNFSPDRAVLSWNPSVNATSVSIERLTKNGDWQPFQIEDNWRGVAEVNMPGADLTAFRVRASIPSWPLPNGNVEPALSNPSEAIYDRKRFSMVEWQTLELASIPEQGDNIRLFAATVDNTRFELKEPMDAISVQDDRLTIRGSASLELAITAYSPLFTDVNPVVRTFDARPARSEFRTFQHPDFASLQWPMDASSLQLVVQDGETLIYSEWPVNDASALVEFWVPANNAIETVRLKTITGSWKEAGSLRSRHFAASIEDGSEFDQDSRPGWVGVMVSSTTSLQSARRGSDKRCFIATSAFESGDDPTVEALRAFRDAILLDSLGKPGQWLVNTYYRVSPGLAVMLDKYPAVKPAVRWLLSKLAMLMR